VKICKDLQLSPRRQGEDKEKLFFMEEVEFQDFAFPLPPLFGGKKRNKFLFSRGGVGNCDGLISRYG
jgi:hypothetical protein